MSANELFEPTIEELPSVLVDPDVVVWVDLDAHGKPQHQLLAEVFKFHPLVIEDAFEEAPQPKIEGFDDYVYMVIHAMDPEKCEPENVVTEEVDIFIGERFVVTHRDETMESVDYVRRRLMANPEIMARGPAFIAHGLVDHITDQYGPLMVEFDEAIDDLELAIIDHPEPSQLNSILSLKHSLQKLRRLGRHQKEILLRLSRGHYPQIPPDAQPFFRDVYDHFQEVVDLADSFRELASSALDAYISVQSHRLNDVMKVLTLISTIMLPLTFIVGLYGMNFKYMPELDWHWGYHTVWGVMVGVAVLMFWFFKKRRWF